MTEPAAGVVYLVGAGPGDPGLLTRRAAEILARADVVFHDGLVSPEVLRLVPDSAHRVALGRRDGIRTLSQDEVNRQLVDAARSGRTVVRLKGGDPCVFGRGGEEAAELAAAGVPFEIVPGVSSAFAAAIYAGIPLVAGPGSPDRPALVTVLSGQEDPEKPSPAIDWGAAARTPGTKVILMGVKRLRSMVAGLRSGGLPAGTPVALVRWATTPRQTTLVGNLGDIADQAEAAGFAAPAVAIVGEAVASRNQAGWFERRPLFGRRIVLTRARSRVTTLSRRLSDLGAEILAIPVVAQDPPSDPAPLKRAVAEIASYDWLIFTSAVGVSAFFEVLLAVHGDLRSLGNARLAAVGPATAACLRDLHLRVDALPEQFRGREIAAAIQKLGNLRDLRVLLARAEVAGADLPRELERAGAIVDDVPVYRTVAAPDEDSDDAARSLRETGADWVLFTSASTVQHFHARFGLPALVQRHPGLRLASIGPETSAALRALGTEPAAEARPHTLDALVAALLAASASEQWGHI